MIREEIEENAESKKKVEEEKEKTPTPPSVDALKSQERDSVSSRLIGVPGPGDIIPPTAETGSTGPTSSNDSIAMEPDSSSIIVRPEVVTDSALPQSKDKALSVADLIALTDLINDSAVC